MEQGSHSVDCADALANVILLFGTGSAFAVVGVVFAALWWAFAVVILAVVLRGFSYLLWWAPTYAVVG
ncbi:hypothetical protein Nepgr_005321 [Nepenthes gracilis]|uniref:Uncharacterized protein n=1 Tax=Nepenthes gracilis TaxID=150966 RepID=A0AAD3S3E4_NEPGR|nr:hypothetical protein Nepgr_005321 [Nepenthes gracilis]